MSERPLYAITIWPEWVYAILHLGKDVELRTWPCWRSLVGQDIALHAGAYPGGPGPKPEGRANIKYFIQRVHQITGSLPPAGWSAEACRIAGSFAGLAQLGEAGRIHSSPWADPDGLVYAWPLLQRRALVELVPHRGAQGLWRVPDELAAQLRTAAVRPVGR